MVVINWWAVIASAVVGMIVGSLWYGPLFGRPWMKMMGMSKDGMTKEMKDRMMRSYALMFVGLIVTATVLTHYLAYAMAFEKVEGWTAGVQVGFWAWLGLVAPVTMGSVLWERKSWKLWILNNGYQLVTLCVMGIILVSWR